MHVYKGPHTMTRLSSKLQSKLICTTCDFTVGLLIMLHCRCYYSTLFCWFHFEFFRLTCDLASFSNTGSSLSHFLSCVCMNITMISSTCSQLPMLKYKLRNYDLIWIMSFLFIGAKLLYLLTGSELINHIDFTKLKLKVGMKTGAQAGYSIV